jgi:hypothetical protein
MSKEDKIKTLIDKPFLDRLTEVAKIYGRHGDYNEIAYFVRNLYDYLDLEVPNLEPYED